MSSYSESTSSPAIMSHLGHIPMLARALAASDYRQIGLGGTALQHRGYPVAMANGIEQIDRAFAVNNDIDPEDVDFVFLSGIYNDRLGTTNATRTAGLNEVTGMNFAPQPGRLVELTGFPAGTRVISSTPQTVFSPNSNDARAILSNPATGSGTALATFRVDVAEEAAKSVELVAAWRAKCPNAVIMWAGSWAGTTGPSEELKALEVASLAAVAAMGDPMVITVPMISGKDPVHDGTGDVTNPNGTGSADINISGDRSHPVARGYLPIRNRALTCLDAYLASL